MAESEEEKVKLEVELPKDEVSLKPVGSEKSLEAKAEQLKQKEVELEAKEKKLKAKDKEEEEGTIAGYKPAEIAKAPLKPPEPEDKKAPTSHQKTVMIFGFVLVVIGIILWPLISFVFGLAVAIAGAIVVAFATLVRV